MVLDHYLIVNRWTPNFNTSTDNTEKLLVWVRFPTLPIEYYDKEFLTRVQGSKISKTVTRTTVLHENHVVNNAQSMMDRGEHHQDPPMQTMDQGLRGMHGICGELGYETETMDGQPQWDDVVMLEGCED